MASRSGHSRDVLRKIEVEFAPTRPHIEHLMSQLRELLATPMDRENAGAAPLRIGHAFEQPGRLSLRSNDQHRLVPFRLRQSIDRHRQMRGRPREHLPSQQGGDQIVSPTLRRVFVEMGREVPGLPLGSANDE